MNKTGKIILGIVVVILAVGLVYWGIAHVSQSQTTSNEPIKIGWIGSLTGEASSIGQNARAVTEIAVAEVNAAGGINGRPLELIYEDGKCNGKDASNAASKLLNVDQVPVILGGMCSSETSSFVTTARDMKKVVMTYCSSAPSLSKSGEYFFRVVPSDTAQGEYAAKYAYNDLGKRRVAILYIQNDWGAGIQEYFIPNFKKLGGEVVEVQSVRPKDKDLRTQMAKIKEANPDLLYFISYTDEAIAGIRQMQELNINVPVLGADAWNDPDIWTTLGQKGEGIQFIKPYSPLSDHLKQVIKERTGKEDVLLCDAGAYDVVKILAKIMKKVGTDPEKIKDALHAMEPYTEGVFASSISFDQNGDIIGAGYEVKIIRDSKMVEYKQ